MPDASPQLIEKAINTIRMLAADAVQQANSGHPGLPMGAADMAFVLWTRHLRFDPKNPRWVGRDRFVLSAGHGSMLLYGLLHLAGFDCTLEDLKRFRQLGSRTPGHPEFAHLPGVEVTSGPLVTSTPGRCPNSGWPAVREPSCRNFLRSSSVQSNPARWSSE